VGAISPELFDALMYVLKMHSYQGWFGIDINPVRMPVETAIKINIDAVQASIDRINELDHASIIYAANHPDKHVAGLTLTLSGQGHPSGKTAPAAPVK